MRVLSNINKGRSWAVQVCRPSVDNYRSPSRSIEMDSQCFDTCESLAILSHHHPLPTPKRQHENRCRCVPLYLRVSPRLGFDIRALLLLLVVFLSCSSLAAPVTAIEAHGDRPALLVEDTDLAWTGSALYLDLSPPPIVPRFMPPLQRDDDAPHILTASPAKRAINTDSGATESDFTIPTAFDAGLSNNFTNSCAKFLNRLRQSEDFVNCHPFSLLIQVSLYVYLHV